MLEQLIRPLSKAERHELVCEAKRIQTLGLGRKEELNAFGDALKKALEPHSDAEGNVVIPKTRKRITTPTKKRKSKTTPISRH
jgi:hypothetical protein